MSWQFTGNLDTWGQNGSYKLSGRYEECVNDADYGMICKYTFTPKSGYNLAAAASGIGKTNQTQNQNIVPLTGTKTDINGALNW
jgi:hypothetical protein